MDVSSNERLRFWYHVLRAEDTRGRRGPETEPAVRPDAVASFMRDAVCGAVTGISASVCLSHTKASAHSLRRSVPVGPAVTSHAVRRRAAP